MLDYVIKSQLNVYMHARANLLSLDQRRQKQILFLLFIYKNRHDDDSRVYARNTRAANVYSFVCEVYHNVKYKNSPYYKGSLLCDNLPVLVKRSLNIIDSKNFIKHIIYYIVRDWSLITGRGGLQNGKIAGPKLFAPPPQDRVKLFAPPLLKSGNFTRPPYNMAKTLSYHVKSILKLFVPPLQNG